MITRREVLKRLARAAHNVRECGKLEDALTMLQMHAISEIVAYDRRFPTDLNDRIEVEIEKATARLMYEARSICESIALEIDSAREIDSE